VPDARPRPGGEVTVRYVFMGQLDPEWAGRQRDRVEATRTKAGELGVEIEWIVYTQGRFDFVAMITASDPYVVEALTMWYLKHRFGRIEALPALEETGMAEAIDRI
jgi:uncharacterized protein with GYD domain